MKWFLFVLILLTSCAHSPRTRHTHGVSILQLATNESTVEFNILLPKGTEASFSVTKPDGASVSPSSLATSERDYSQWTMHHVQFTGLSFSPENFQLVVTSQGQKVDQRAFKLFSPQGERLRFVVGACSDVRALQKQSAIWQAVAAQNPEWVFLIGDNVYAAQTEREITDPKVLWERYVDHRLALDIYRWKQLIPTHSVWDDNDYGQKDGGKDYALRAEAESTFRAFFLPKFPNDSLTPGPGISHRLALRGFHVSFLDNRSFRGAGDSAGEHFGVAQEDWLFEGMKSSWPTFIISGDQFMGGYHKYESYEGQHPAAFLRFVERLKTTQTPFVFVSGDRHMTEIMQFPRALLGQLSFEFTTSPLHGNVYPKSGLADPNPWRVVAHDESLNFMTFETWPDENSWHLSVAAVNETGATLFARQLSLTLEALKDFTIEKRQKRRKYRRARLRRR